MRSTIFTVTLTLLVIWSYEQQQQGQQQQSDEHKQQEMEPEQEPKQQENKFEQKHYNLSIMLNAIDSDMPLSLQHSIAACCSIIREHFAPSTDSFMVSTNVQQTYLKRHRNDFLNNVLLNLTMIKVEIESINSEVRDQTFNRKFNLIVVEDVESLRELDPAKYTRNYDLQEHYLVYLMHAARFNDIMQVINDIFAYFWENSIINVTLMKANRNTVVETYTYFPFESFESCKVPLVKLLNTYSGSWSKSVALTMFPSKIMDLQNCPLGVAVWDTPPYLSYTKNDAGFYDIDYFEAKLLKVLSKKLNFTLDLKEPPNNEQRGKVLENGTLTGAMKMLYNHSADLSLGAFLYTLERSNVLTAALPYYQTFQIFGILTTSQLYTSLELYAYPFDELTWCCVLGSFCMGLYMAFVLDRFYSRSLLIRVAVGFPPLRTPSLNVVRFLLGQNLVQTPGTHFARFSIIAWHIYGILLRTAYQSLLFQLAKMNVYHEPPKTLKELIMKNYSLVMIETIYDSVHNIPRITQGAIDVIRLKNASQQTPFFYMEQHDHQQCLASVSPKDFLTYHIIEEKKWGLFYILPENIFTIHITTYFSKHSYLTSRFNELVLNMRSMGIIDFWARQGLDDSGLDNKQGPNFAPITLEDLEGIFYIYIILTSIAVIIFFLEIFVFKMKLLLYRKFAKLMKK
ncbi:uncharacterized protein ACRADG_007510 isoform 1-T1 [Cochliomyia hominivorax]